MAKENYIVGLDIGTQNIRVVQAKVEDDGSLNVIGAGSVTAAGMRKGVIVDIEEAVSSISAALEKVERMTGVPVTRANVSVGGNHVACLDSKGVIAVSRADGEITENDVVRVIDASQAISIPANREVLHVIPKTFTLDGQIGIKDPIGMTGIRLEVETVIIHGALPFLKNLNKTILQTGLEIDQLVLSPLAAAQSTLNKRQKELGVALIDFGAGTTSIAIYEENNLLHTAILPIGSMHITNDIAIGLRCTIETAEKVKLMYGNADLSEVDRHEQIDMSKIDPEEDERVSRTMVVEIIEARLEEIFEYINKELKKINRDGKLPGGIVLTGGGSELPGLADFAKKHLRLPVSIGQPQELKSIIDQVQDPSFATVTGLALWGSRYSDGSGITGNLSGFAGRLLENQNVIKLKKLFKSFLP
jgi:cell division protein FtsA